MKEQINSLNESAEIEWQCIMSSVVTQYAMEEEMQ